MADQDWFEDYAEDADDIQIDEYDITATPNDFNVLTLFSFIESGAVRIPGFQRNFVWDQVRSSKLIESLILGIPVPQIFLYEQGRNRFLVIDGQQRLMTVYYFLKRRFPKRDKRVELRQIFDENGSIPDFVLHNDAYFDDFKLKLTPKLPDSKSQFSGLNYLTLGEFKTQLDLRPIRNIIVKQNSPADDDSSMYEVFNRLNTGGINLRPQEIRTSMYHSKFYDTLYKINLHPTWRRLTKFPEPDIHMKDIEIILRGFAMLMTGDQYKPSLVRFLNHFSRLCERNTNDQNEYLNNLFDSFLLSASDLPEDTFINTNNNRFNIALYEAVFTAACGAAFKQRRMLHGKLSTESISDLENDASFSRAALEGTTRTANVEMRLKRASELIPSL